MRRRSRKSGVGSGGRLVLDTSFLIEVLDRGRRDLVNVLAGYDEIIIPWICLYEYLYGHRVGRRAGREEVLERKEKVEALGLVYYGDQKIVENALELELELTKRGRKIPFSDLLVASFTLTFDADLATLDEKHFEFIKDRIVT